MDNENWLLEQLDKLINKTESFDDKSLLIATKQLVKDSSARIQQAQDELDGRAWSSKKW